MVVNGVSLPYVRLFELMQSKLANKIRDMAFDLLAFVTLTWHGSTSADICFHGSDQQAPPTKSARESSALWFLDREGRPIRAGKHRLLLSSTASPFAGLDFQSKTLQEKKAKGGIWNLVVGGNQPAFALVFAHKHINSQVENRVGIKEGEQKWERFWCENSSSQCQDIKFELRRWGRGLAQQRSWKF